MDPYNLMRYQVSSFLLFLFSILLLLLISCNKEQDPSSSSVSALIKMSGQDNSGVTKTSINGFVTQWIATQDKVGVYSPQAKSTPGGAAGVVNAEYAAVSSAFSSSFSGTMYWGTGSHDFYAYYPFSSGSYPYSSVPVTLPASQLQAGTTTSHVGSYDYMVATPLTGVSPQTEGTSTTVNFRYNHIFTLLEFKIKIPSGTDRITKIKLTAAAGKTLAFTSASIDISQALPDAGVSYTINSISGATNEIILNISGNVDLTSDWETTPSFFMTMMPADHTGDNLTVGVETLNSGGYTYYTKAGINFERGKKYLVSLENPWHPYSPVTIGGVIWAPVNVGYSASNKYGQMFQWGRMYGQGRDNEGITAGKVSVSVGNDIANSAKFYTSTGDWCTPALSSWDMSLYNPCPSGWMFPTYLVYFNLESSGSTWTDAGGPDNLAGRWIGPGNSVEETRATTSIFLPAAGNRQYNNGLFGSSNYYWTSTISGSLSFQVSFSSSSYGRSTNIRGYGAAIRCVKN